MTSRPLRVFLCHSSNDKPAVRELYQKLRAEAWIQPWLDEEELYPGQDWNMEIEKAVEAADAIIVCLSKGSNTKEGYIQRELRIVLDYADYKPEGTLYIIPVRLEECESPRRLRAWQYADYFEGQRDRAFQRLLFSLKKRADSLGLEIEQSTKKETKPEAILVQNQPKPTEEKKPVIEAPNKLASVANPTKENLRLIGIGGIILLALIYGALGLNYLVQNLPAATATVNPQNLPVAITTATLQTEIPVKISSIVGEGTLNSEIVVVKYEGKGQLNMSLWQLKDENGNIFTFPNFTLYQNGAVQIHTVIGTNTVIDLYWGLRDAIWNSGEYARLFDSQGNLRAVYRVP